MLRVYNYQKLDFTFRQFILKIFILTKIETEKQMSPKMKKI